MRLILVLLTLHLGLVCNGQDVQISEKKDLEIIAYYQGGVDEVENLNADQLDQIIFSFLRLNGNELAIANEDQKLTIQKLVELKKERPSLKILISLGGWGGCETCSKMFSKSENRKAFAKSVLKILKNYGADGIDLDWEYPAIESLPGHRYKSADKTNFTLLVKAIRETLGYNYIISFAAGAQKEYLDNSIEWDKVMPLVNNVNLMTYDLVNGYSTITGHHANLYSTNKQILSGDYSIKYLDSLGVPMNKIVIGAAFYGRIWQGVASTNNGLYQKGIFETWIIYKDLQEFLATGYIQHWDSTACAPYAYNRHEKKFLTYDNKKSVEIKTKYAKKQGLKGVMFWEVQQDSKEGLLHTIWKNK